MNMRRIHIRIICQDLFIFVNYSFYSYYSYSFRSSTYGFKPSRRTEADRNMLAQSIISFV
jgi:hypothetical protein